MRLTGRGLMVGLTGGIGAGKSAVAKRLAERGAVVIDADRLARGRGMTEEEAYARIRSQATDDERRAVADIVIVNDGSMEDLNARVDAVWAERLMPGA